MMATLHTNQGVIKIELDHQNTPKTVANFQQYAKSGFYQKTLFHRVIDGFMIQGGGLDLDMNTKSTEAPIENEAKFGQANKVGSVAMARTSDPHSATSQFFINVNNNDFLNFKAENPDGFGYCVFGQVVEGMDVVKQISKASTGNQAGHQDVPTEQIIIESVDIEQTEAIA